MKKFTSAFGFMFLAASAILLPVVAKTETLTTAPTKTVHGEYQDWLLLSVSHRLDKKSLRAILGNSTAVKAARQNNTNPWPEGTILAKVVWKETTHSNWPQAIVPGELEKAEAMIKDSKKYAKTGGWGFAYWEGKKLVPHPEAKAQECFACHAPMKQHDYVYTSSMLQ